MKDPIGYAYEADIHCPHCTEKRFGADCEGTDKEGNEVSACWNYDEADSPQHCGDCGEFLGGSLTSDGYEYVKQAILDDLASGRLDSPAITEWAPFYDLDIAPKAGDI